MIDTEAMIEDWIESFKTMMEAGLINREDAEDILNTLRYCVDDQEFLDE